MRLGRLSRPVNRGDIESVLFGAVLGGLATFFCTIDGYPTAAILFCTLLVCPICVILHELGHAWATSLVRGEVRYIQLGKQRSDRAPRRFTLAGYPWIVYGVPFSGSVSSDILTTNWVRTRRCCLIAAGPAMNLILLIGALFLAERHQSQTVSALSIAVILANTIILFYTVPPRTYPPESIVRLSDGLLFWRTLRSSAEDIEISVAQSRMAHRFIEGVRKLEDLSLSQLITEHEAEPGNISVLWSLADRLLLIDDPRYGEFATKLISHPELAKPYIPIAIDTYLTWQLHHGPPADADSAISLSDRLVELRDTNSTRGTRGAVLVDSGFLKGGRAVLEDVLKRATSDVEKTYTNVFLALAAKKEGHFASSLSYARAAARLSPESPVLARISDLLAEQEAQST